MHEVPTLLIGLGGVGSSIVDRVYGMIPPERRSRIAVHAFDTNVNDIKQLRHLKGRVTQTSTNWTVGQYLYHAEEHVRDWFQDEDRELRRKLLTDGAGQVRQVSRLAYRAAMENGKLTALQSQIGEVFRATGDDSLSAVRVMICCTLAGGTGAGIFLQTALYLRELLDRRFGKKNVLVRGAFILPDTLVLSNTLDATEWENVRANTYASMKELDAIIKNEGVTIELEYRPGQTDLMGRPSLALTDEHLPYRFSFLYDYENTAGENLGGFGNYIDQVIKTLYVQLFTPIAADAFSVEDNRILSLIESEGRARYGGAGVATLTYPYDDLVQYCALRWSTDNLSDAWLKLDDDFEQELRQYERDLQAGVARTRPKIEERYPQLLLSYASDENPQPFFRQAFAQTRLQDKQGRPTMPLAQSFLQSIDDEIEKRISEDAEVAQLAAQAELIDEELSERALAADHVQDVEEALWALGERVKKAIDENKVFLTNQILLRDYDEPSGAGGQAYRLNTWMLRSPEALHPVSVRTVLYETTLLLEDRLRTLGPENEQRKAGLDRYRESYDDPETEDVIESPEDRVRTALDQGVLRRLLDNRFKDFVEEYRDKATRQKRSLQRYYKDRLTELVLRETLRALQAMLSEWERYFQNLRETRNALLRERNQRAAEHERVADPTKRFVLATQAAKEALWEDIRLQFVGTMLPEEIAREIYLGQYRRFVAARLGERIEAQVASTTEAQFRQDVVAWCRAQLGKVDRLDLNVMEALRREAQATKDAGEATNEDAYMGDQLKRLDNLARPFVPEAPGTARIKFWGLHPESLESLHEDQREAWLGEGRVEDAAFSRREVVRYQSLYGLTAQDFPKFSAGDRDEGRAAGAYFRAYQERIRKLTGQADVRSVTPHLDKRWHLPAYLPDLNEAFHAQDMQRIDAALLRGLAHGLFKVVREDGREVWEFTGTAGPQLVRIHGEPVLGQLHELHGALLFNPAIVDQALEKADDARARDRQQYPMTQPQTIARHAFYAGAKAVPGLEGTPSLLDAVLAYPQADPADERLPEQSADLLRDLLDEIERYFLYAYGPTKANTAGQSAANLMDKLREESSVYQSADERSALRSRWDSVVDAKLDALRG
ncbi:MAG: tubulin-like doman-containing protein [Bacteroidota bacterium]